MKSNRVHKVIEQMKKQGLTQLIVSAPSSIFYLTGKWISSGERMLALYINVDGNHKFIVNKLFPINEDLGVDIIWYSDVEDPIELLCTVVDKEKALGVDKIWPSHFLISLIDRKGATSFVNSSPIIDRLRMIKDDEEIAIMKKSSEINDKVMTELLSHIKEGYSEKYYCDLLKELYGKYGVNSVSFSPIVAVSPNGANPHHESDDTVVRKGQSIVIDIGGVYNSYCSDMTRTIFVGEEPNERHKEIYNVVKEANLKAISIVKEGVKFSDIDKAARQHIERSGYGEYFTHRTGHSVGIEVHDFGDVSSVNDDEVKAGMIFSIEPGVYLRDDFGVRIEDLVLVTKDGCEVLNKVSKEITVL